MDTKEQMSNRELEGWAKNELEITGDDPEHGGEVLVARSVLRLLSDYEDCQRLHQKKYVEHFRP